MPLGLFFAVIFFLLYKNMIAYEGIETPGVFGGLLILTVGTIFVFIVGLIIWASIQQRHLFKGGKK